MIAVFQPFARLAPSNAKAFGCYVADDAPPIRLDQRGMSILQRSFPTIPFHLERHKTAITLTADAPIQADLVGNRFVYSMYSPGIGWFLDFQRIVNGKRRGEFNEDKLSMFVMLARNYAEIVYRKSDPIACETG